MAKEHTVTKLRLLLQEADASPLEKQSLENYMSGKLGYEWGSLHLADNGYFIVLQKLPALVALEKMTELFKARSFSFKRVSGRNALDTLRKVSSSQETKMDRKLLKILHAKAAEGKLYKVTRSG